MMKKKMVVLDLDRTLVYARRGYLARSQYDFIVKTGCFQRWYVQKRPHVDRLLKELAKNYAIVVFTSSTESYADAILDKLDVNNVVDVRLYRDSCTQMGSAYVKDLAKLGNDLKNVIIVDDNSASYKFQPQNAFPVKAFTGDLSDKELMKVIDFCESAANYDDVREATRKHRLDFCGKAINYDDVREARKYLNV